MNKTHQAISLLIVSSVVKKPETFYKTLSDLMTNDLFRLMGDEYDIAKVEKEKWHMKSVLHDVAYLMSGGVIEHRHVKRILKDAWEMEPYAWDIGWYLLDSKLLEEKNGDELEEIILKVLKDNEKVVKDIKSGKTKAIGSLIGPIMRLSGGKADPKLINKKIMELT